MKSKEIRSKLKNELGYSSRQVSVKENSCGYSWSFSLTIRDASVDYKKVSDFANSLKRADRCKVTGEILSGGNLFIDVVVLEKVKEIWSEKYMEDVAISIAILMNSEDNSLIDINDRAMVGKNGDHTVRLYIDGVGKMNFNHESIKAMSFYLHRELSA